MRPIAQRVGSLLLGLLLVTSIVAGPAAAATGSTAPTADTRSAATASMSTADLAAANECDLWASVLGQCTGPLEFIKVGEDQSARAVKTDLHVTMSGEWENQQAFLTQTNNYLEDTRTVASIDSKAAIADSWERGDSTAQATQNAREAIRDYYALQQIQLLNKYQQQMAQADYTHNVSYENPDIDNQFLSLGVKNLEVRRWYSDGYSYSSGEAAGTHYDAPTQDVDITLVNGSTETITVPTWKVEKVGVGANGYNYNRSFAVEPFQRWTTTANDTLKTPWSPPGGAYNRSIRAETTGIYAVQNVGNVSEGGLPSKRVVDLWEWRRTWDRIEKQSQTMTSNYDSKITENLYAALDSGQIDPEDVRGAEGQVRWLSGNSTVGDRRWQQATLSVLDLANQNRSQANQIVVSYTGFTDLSFSDSTNGSRKPVYGDYVNGTTYSGMLFANPPSGGFTAGETYNVADLEGTPTMYDNETGETIPLVKGNVTIEAMYAANGSEVDNADWDDPQYDTYNSTQYVEYINKSKTHRKYITNNYTTTTASGGGGLSFDFGFGGDGPDAGDIFGGVVIMALAGGAVVLVVLRG